MAASGKIGCDELAQGGSMMPGQRMFIKPQSMQDYLSEAKCSPGKPHFECGDLNELKRKRLEKRSKTYENDSIFNSASLGDRLSGEDDSTDPTTTATTSTTTTTTTPDITTSDQAVSRHQEEVKLLGEKYSETYLFRDETHNIDSLTLRKHSLLAGARMVEQKKKEVKLKTPIGSAIFKNRRKLSVDLGLQTE